MKTVGLRSLSISVLKPLGFFAFLTLALCASAQDQTITGNLTVGGGSTTIISASGSDSTVNLNQVGIRQWSLRNVATTGALTLSTGGNDWVSIAGSSGSASFTGTLTVNGTGTSSFAGNVGVGTSNPTHKLEVVGSIGFGSMTPDNWRPVLGGSNGVYLQPFIGLANADAAMSKLNIALKADSIPDSGNAPSGFAGPEVNIWNTGATKFLALHSSGVQTSDSSSLALNPNGGNVGIGVGSPATRLQVGGSITVSGDNQKFIARYTDTDESYSGTLGWGTLQLGNNGLNTIAAGRTASGGALRFVVNNTANLTGDGSNANGVEAMRIDPSGNVGIGTASPGRRLDVAGSVAGIKVTDTGGSYSGYIEGASGSTVNWVLGKVSYNHMNGSTLGLGTFGAVPLELFTNNAERMRIDQNGNVGIGTTNTNAGTLTVFNSAGNTLTLQKAGGGAALAFGSDTTENLLIEAVSGGGMQIYTGGGAWGSAWTSRLYLSGAGNLGIGTTNPSAKLDVAGNTNISGNLTVSGTFSAPSYTASSGAITGGTSGLALNAGGTNQSVTLNASGTGGILLNANVAVGAPLSGYKLAVQSGSGVTQNGLLITTTDTDQSNIFLHSNGPTAGDKNWLISTNYTSAGNFEIRQSNATAGNPFTAGASRFVIDPAGNVGVGTTSPTQRLEVNGQIKSFPSTASRGTYFGTDNSGSYIGNNAYVIPNGGWFNDSTTLASSILYQSGGQLDFYTRAAGAAAGTGNSVFTIAQSGNVGVGTTNPTARIQSSNYPSAAAFEGIDIQSAYSPDSAQKALTWRDGANIVGQIDTRYDGATMDMVFGHLYNSGYNSTDRMVIKGNGNVGIGTTSPANTLDIRNGGGADNLSWGSATSIYGHIRYDAATTTANIYSSGGTKLSLGANSVAQLVLDPAGNVGVGTTSPQAKFDVVGDAMVSGNLSVSGTFSAPNYTASSGTIAGGSTGLTLNAGGTEQSVILQGSGYGGAVMAQNTNGTDSYPLRVKNGMMKTNNNYVGFLLQSNDTTNPLTGGLILYGGSNRRIELNAYDNGVGPANVVVPYGNVGIGTTSPATKLEIGGNGAIAYLNATDNVSTLSFGRSDYSWRVANETDFRIYGGAGRTPSANTNLALAIKNGSGNIGIGVADPGAYKLAVNGTIHAKEVIVDQLGWADNVFDADYRNAPLSEVEEHIKEHGHLPGVPSAQEVAEKGVNVGQMQTVLLQKIEELTLHVIEQEKRIDRLEKENAVLRNR